MSRAGGGPLQFDLMSSRIMEIDRGTGAFRAIALDGFADRYAERRETRDDGVTVERFDGEAEVTYFGRLAGALARDQVEQRGASAHLHQADAVEFALDVETERLFIEADHAGQVAAAQHDMVDSFDMEGHGVHT